MSDTPRTNDRVVFIHGNTWVNAPFVKGLERELIEANQRINRLEEALDTLTCVVGLTPILGNKAAMQEAFDMARTVLKAKEDKL